MAYDGLVTETPADPENWRYVVDGSLRGWVPLSHEEIGRRAAEAAAAMLPTSADVRAEASRRMQAAFGARDAGHLEIIVANATREVARLNQIKVGVPAADGSWLVAPREWSAEERARLAALHAADLLLEAIRAASNAMEASPPADYADDSRWP